MIWSRFNKLIHHNERGWHAYNALSNTLVELDEAHYEMLEKLKRTGEVTLVTDEDFNNLLCERLFLIQTEEEDGQLLVRQHQRQTLCFESSVLGLTICPTLRCNFRCPYCFESCQENGKKMASNTQARLVDWVKQHRSVNTLSVTWYGGEPLLEFDTICDLTKKFLALDVHYQNAALITNGYLLDPHKIARLNDLRITTIQITLDGPRHIHDSRRFIAGGGPTFDRILNNIALLMESEYNGQCHIRVNVDRHNLKQYLELHAELLKRFDDARLLVYPGHVEASLSHSYGKNGCCLDNDEWSIFALELYNKHSIIPSKGFYPTDFTYGICLANNKNGFVVGPEGELYKCWDDAGNSEMVIGNIHKKYFITNQILQARYVTGADAYRDPECSSCNVLPICGGGCVNKRMRNRLYNEKGLSCCSPYKNHLSDYLKAYIDSLYKKELCEEVLTPGKKQQQSNGYRLIAPLDLATD